MAVRSAISRCRAAALASSRLATLAQAISSTKPTAPHSTRSAGRRSPTICSEIGVRRTEKPLSVCGKSFARRWQMASSSALAAAMPMPGRSRPMVTKKRLVRSARMSTGSACGSQASGSSAKPKACGTSVPRGKAKRGGMTPTTVSGMPLSRILVPRTRGSAPKRRCHQW
jgi:hypothetical protein